MCTTTFGSDLHFGKHPLLCCVVNLLQVRRAEAKRQKEVTGMEGWDWMELLLEGYW